jgi:hypothetical protein
MLIHRQGNLLDLAENGEFDVILHGANCFNTMGAGIAREISARYPMAAAVDMETTRGDYTKLGNWTECAVDAGKGFTILNCYTQHSVSRDTDVFEYIAFALILQKLLHIYGTERLGFPYIGMGLAGGNKETIMSLIEEFAQGVTTKGGSVTLVSYDPGSK